jgi:mono/diheme cytochrome c family protein
MFFKNNYKKVFHSLLASALLMACAAEGDYPGVEYAPQMYHSVAYEPLTQIKDENAGRFVSSREDGRGEFFNSNLYNPHAMNMRKPPANTVKRDPRGYLPYRIHPDSIEVAARVLKNPTEDTELNLQRGQVLYKRFCAHCHGETGQGDGSVGQVYAGVPPYNVGRVRNLNEGHIYHVITYGRGRMAPHGSQVDEEERWLITRYVQQLQRAGEN